MIIEYFIPPAAQSRGGIDLAVNGMRGALQGDHEIALRFEGSPHPDTELVHFHGLWNANHLLAYRECQRRSLPYVISPHGMLEPWAYRSKRWKKWPWMMLLGRRHFNQAASVLATSKMEAANLRPFAKRIDTAPLGLNEDPSFGRDEARRTLGIDEGQKIILYLSRIDRKKGLDLLVKAMDEIHGWELWIVGDGDEEFAAELKSKSCERVRWLDPAWEEDRWIYLLAADLFCLPTHSENFGFAILEALWSGTPTLTTTKTPWEAHRDVDGLHICEDNLDSLRSKLLSLLPDLPRPESLKDWARDNFHWDRVAADYDRIYLKAATR